MEEMLMNIDPMVLYLAGGVLILIVIVSIILKAIKIAVLAAIIAALFMFFGPKSAEMQEKYNVKYDEGIVTVTLDGEIHEINTDDLKNVRIEERDGDTYVVYVSNGEEKSVKIPMYMKPLVSAKLEEISNQEE